MSCKELMDGAIKKQNESKMDCPILLYPACHKKAHMVVHCDGKKRIIYLSCSKCDRLISICKLRAPIPNL